MKKVLLAAVVALTAMGANAQIARSTMFQAPERENNIMWYFRAGVSINNAAGNGDFKDGYKDSDGKTDTGLGSKAGYDFQFGFNKTIGGTDAYWGMEFGFGTRGYSQKFEEAYSENFGPNNQYVATVSGMEKESLLAHTFKITPVMFGYKYGITDKIKIDAHLGAFISIDMAGKLKEESEYSLVNNWDSDYNRFESSKEDYSIGDLKDSDGDSYYNRFDAGIQAGIGVWYGRWNLDFTYERGFCSFYKYEEYDGHKASLASSNAVIRLGFAF
jgi:hypothetical protein